MLTFDIISPQLAPDRLQDEELAVEAIEDVIREFELDVAQRTTLSTMRGSTHYHLKMGAEKGVLEITFWPKKAQLTVAIHENRRAPWNERMIEPLAWALAERFAGRARELRGQDGTVKDVW